MLGKKLIHKNKFPYDEKKEIFTWLEIEINSSFFSKKEEMEGKRIGL